MLYFSAMKWYRALVCAVKDCRGRQDYSSSRRFWILLSLLSVCLFSGLAAAHGVDDATRSFLTQNEGAAPIVFAYIGAKHMITGYDHLLFLAGVIFLLFRWQDILLFVSLFTLGHSVTLLAGVLLNWQVNAWLIDAIIGLSVIYKGFDNLGGFRRLFGWQPDTRVAVLVFGLFHGLGLATKLQEFEMGEQGRLANLLAFNVGVEIGQFAALGLLLLLLSFWRRHPGWRHFNWHVNVALISAGMMLMGYQLTGYVTS